MASVAESNTKTEVQDQDEKRKLVIPSTFRTSINVPVKFVLPDSTRYAIDLEIEIQSGMFYGTVLKNIYRFLKQQEEHKEFMTKYQWHDVSLDDHFLSPALASECFRTDGSSVYIQVYDRIYSFQTIWIYCLLRVSSVRSPLNTLLLTVT